MNHKLKDVFKGKVVTTWNAPPLTLTVQLLFCTSQAHSIS